MDTWNRLTDLREDGGRGDWIKEGEGISQRTYMHSSGTRYNNVMKAGVGGLGARWRWAKGGNGGHV